MVNSSSTYKEVNLGSWCDARILEMSDGWGPSMPIYHRRHRAFEAALSNPPGPFRYSNARRPSTWLAIKWQEHFKYDHQRLRERQGSRRDDSKPPGWPKLEVQLAEKRCSELETVMVSPAPGSFPVVFVHFSPPRSSSSNRYMYVWWYLLLAVPQATPALNPKVCIHRTYGAKSLRST